MTNKQIEKDLLRIMPANACFSHLHSTGIPRLRRVMRALAWLYPDIGYEEILMCSSNFVSQVNANLIDVTQHIYIELFFFNKLLPGHWYNGGIVVVAPRRGRCILDDGDNSGRLVTSLLLFFYVVRY